MVVIFVEGVVLGLVVAAGVGTAVTTGTGVAFTVSVGAGTVVPAGTTGVSFAVSTVVGGVTADRVVHPLDAMSRNTIINRTIQLFFIN